MQQTKCRIEKTFSSCVGANINNTHKQFSQPAIADVRLRYALSFVLVCKSPKIFLRHEPVFSIVAAVTVVRTFFEDSVQKFWLL